MAETEERQTGCVDGCLSMTGSFLAWIIPGLFGVGGLIILVMAVIANASWNAGQEIAARAAQSTPVVVLNNATTGEATAAGAGLAILLAGIVVVGLLIAVFRAMVAGAEHAA